MQSQTIRISKKKLKLAIFAVVTVTLFFVGLNFSRNAPTVKASMIKIGYSTKKLPLLGQYIPSSWFPRREIAEQVLPSEGFQSRIIFGDVIPKMVSSGVIDMQKLEANYKKKGGIPKDIQILLTQPSNTPIILTKQNSAWLITLLWPFGLTNKMAINKQSPVAEDVNNFASTGGWTLGKAENGGEYFNKNSILSLTPKQEQRVKALAENIHRPCCNNSAFFQDCNHGSAALGLVELGVSQGLSDDEIYKTVLAFNSFWFPQNYMETALYFQKVKGQEWEDLNPKVLLSKDYSSIKGWMTNVDSIARKTPGIVPADLGGSNCAV